MYFVKFLTNKSNTNEPNLIFGLYLEIYILYSFFISFTQFLMGNWSQLPLYLSLILPLGFILYKMQRKVTAEYLPVLYIISIFFYFLMIDRGISSGDLSFSHYIFLIAGINFIYSNYRNLLFTITILLSILGVIMSFFIPLNYNVIYNSSSIVNSQMLPKFMIDMVTIMTLIVSTVYYFNRYSSQLNKEFITSNTMFSDLLSNSGDYVMLLDERKRIKMYNERIQKLFKQYSNIDIYIGQSVDEIKFRPNVYNDFKYAFQRSFLGEKVVKELELELNTGKAEVPHMSVIHFTFNPILENNDTVISVAVIGVDENEQLKREREILINEERLSNALESSKEGVWDWDFVTGIFFITESWKKMLGYSNDELAYKIDTLSELLHPDDKDETFRQISRHIKGETEFYTTEYRMHCKDGSYKWIESKGKITEFNPDLSPRRFTGIHTDITLKKLNENKILDLKNFYESILENNNTAISVYDTRLQLIYANPASINDEEKRKKAIGKNIKDIMQDIEKPQELRDEIVLKFKQALKSEEVVEWDEEYSTSSKFYSHKLRLIPIFNKNNILEHFIYIAIDLSAIKSVQRELILAKETAENALNIKQQFLSTISHEIRTPLNGIMGITNILIDENINSEQFNNLNILKNSSQQLINLVNDLLDFSKIESGNLDIVHAPFDILEEVKDTVLSHKVTANQKKIKITLDIDKSIPNQVIGDGLRINQILNNLLNNAVKFTNIGGKIAVTLKTLKSEPDKCKIYFEVRDNGIGVAEDQQERIFEMFTQASVDTNRKYGGTGLGLAIIKKLLTQMDSDIHLESAVHKGSKFYFTIQFDNAVQALSNEIPILKFDLQNIHKLNILVAEDNPTNLFILKKYLNKIKSKIVHAENGRLALDYSRIEKFDIILMDIQMPELDGYEASYIIRNDEKNINHSVPILAVTADVTKEIEVNCKNAGMNDILIKPFSPEQLYEKIYLHTQAIETDI